MTARESKRLRTIPWAAISSATCFSPAPILLAIATEIPIPSPLPIPVRRKYRDDTMPTAARASVPRFEHQKVSTKVLTWLMANETSMASTIRTSGSIP